MKPLNNKELILSLIKDDLISTKLVNGLNEIGLNADSYYLHLSEIIFRLLGFDDDERSDEVYEKYLEFTEKAKYIDISDSHKPMDELALEIYNEFSLYILKKLT